MFELTPFARGNHIAAYDPFKEMEEFEKRVFGRQASSFQTDIRETDHAYILEANLPGFAKEDIHAEIKNGYLTIHAEHLSDQADQNENGEAGKAGENVRYIRRERSYGSFTRSFDLEGIKSEDISAAYQNGVLTLTLPKLDTAPDVGRQLEIQ